MTDRERELRAIIRAAQDLPRGPERKAILAKARVQLHYLTEIKSERPFEMVKNHARFGCQSVKG